MTSGPDAVGRLAALDQVHASLRRSSLLGIPCSMLLALILWAAVPTSRLVVFVALVSCADIAAYVGAGHYLRRRQKGQTPLRCWPTLLAAAAVGAAWGSLALTGLPPENHVDLRVVYLLFVCGVSATFVVSTAAERRFYFASQLPMLSTIAVAFISTGNATTRLVGLAVPMYFIVMTGLHAEVHKLVLSEMNLRAEVDRSNALLTTRAMHDDLTGLANRAAFIDALTKTVGVETSKTGFAGILYLDVDRFKVVNDSLGHVAGDKLLVAMSRRLERLVDEGDLLARVGGDEFTVLMTALRSHDDAIGRAMRIAAAFTEPFVVHAREIKVTASIGVATTFENDEDSNALLAHADAAQYRAKVGGRNRVEVFDVRLREALERQLDSEQELRRAIESGEIVPWFQPLVDLKSGQIVGAEALARWEHPRKGLIEAAQFIPLAEETGLVHQLDPAIVVGALAARAELARVGVPRTFRIWCNVSATQFANADPTAHLAAAMQRTGCDPSGVGIEITETAILHDVNAAAQEVRAARDLGVEVALDDFGTGHSSLTLLRELRIDKVKIDRTFVRDATRAGADAAIIQCVIDLAKQLRIDVVAEGVETPEQAHLLRELGCQYAQGFLWSRAVPFNELVSQLAATNNAPRLVERISHVQPARPTELIVSNASIDER